MADPPGLLLIQSDPIVDNQGRPSIQFVAKFNRIASGRLQTREIDSNTRAVSSDFLFLVDASAGAVVISLPPAANLRGKALEAKKIDATANAMTFDPDGAETIDGAGSLSTTTQWAAYTIYSNGTEWFVI